MSFTLKGTGTGFGKTYFYLLWFIRYINYYFLLSTINYKLQPNHSEKYILWVLLWTERSKYLCNNNKTVKHTWNYFYLHFLISKCNDENMSQQLKKDMEKLRFFKNKSWDKSRQKYLFPWKVHWYHGQNRGRSNWFWKQTWKCDREKMNTRLMKLTFQAKRKYPKKLLSGPYPFKFFKDCLSQI